MAFLLYWIKKNNIWEAERNHWLFYQPWGTDVMGFKVNGGKKKIVEDSVAKYDTSMITGLDDIYEKLLFKKKKILNLIHDGELSVVKNGRTYVITENMLIQ